MAMNLCLFTIYTCISFHSQIFPFLLGEACKLFNIIKWNIWNNPFYIAHTFNTNMPRRIWDADSFPWTIQCTAWMLMYMWCLCILCEHRYTNIWLYWSLSVTTASWDNFLYILHPRNQGWSRGTWHNTL